MSRQKFVRSADSKSLWNCTLSPGWSKEENEILRAAIMKYGLGAWTAILKAKVLPGKTAAQLNLQTQRMLGQQSLGGFMGIKLDASRVWEENNKKQGPEYKRKNGCIVNTGNNPTKEERRRQIDENRKIYQLTAEEIGSVVIPTREEAPIVSVNTQQEKKAKLKRLKSILQYMEEKYRQSFGEVPELPPVPIASDLKAIEKKPKKAKGKNGKPKKKIK